MHRWYLTQRICKYGCTTFVTYNTLFLNMNLVLLYKYTRLMLRNSLTDSHKPRGGGVFMTLIHPWLVLQGKKSVLVERVWQSQNCLQSRAAASVVPSLFVPKIDGVALQLEGESMPTTFWSGIGQIPDLSKVIFHMVNVES